MSPVSRANDDDAAGPGADAPGLYAQRLLRRLRAPEDTSDHSGMETLTTV